MIMSSANDWALEKDISRSMSSLLFVSFVFGKTLIVLSKSGPAVHGDILL